MRRLLEARREGEIRAAFGSCVHPAFRFAVAGANDPELRSLVPWAGCEHRGLEGYLRLTALLLSEFEPLVFEMVRFTDAGDLVFVEGRYRLRHRETARVAAGDFLTRFEIRDGRMVSGQSYENTAAIAEARRPF